MYPERISVRDLMPQSDEQVIVYSANTGVHRGRYDERDGWVDVFGAKVERVTHWWPVHGPLLRKSA